MKDTLRQITKFLEILDTLSIPYVLIGGVAVGIWSVERFTKDIDFTISLDKNSWKELKKYLETSKDIIIDKIAYDQEAHDQLPFLIRLKYKNQDIDLIVSLTEYQNCLLERSISTDFLERKISVASPEDIIVSKLIAQRSQDLVDIENILKQVKNLDLDYIQKWSHEWETEGVWKDIRAKILK